MRNVARLLCGLFLAAPAACSGPPEVPPGNPLLGSWQVVSAAGVGTQSVRRLTFAPDAILADDRQPVAVRAYQITRTKVHVLEVGGRVRTYRVIHGGLICAEPPPEQLFRNFPPFESDRERSEACYRRAPGGRQVAPQRDPPGA